MTVHVCSSQLQDSNLALLTKLSQAVVEMHHTLTHPQCLTLCITASTPCQATACSQAQVCAGIVLLEALLDLLHALGVLVAIVLLQPVHHLGMHAAKGVQQLPKLATWHRH